MGKTIRPNTIYIHPYQSNYIKLILGSFDDKLCLCSWVIRNHKFTIDKRIQDSLNANYELGNSDIISKAIKQLDEYFDGKRTLFDIPLLFVGTDFQKTVWHKLMEIPYGKTISYKELAIQIDNPRAVRAVANANGANAISIFVPCHRVIGNDNSLTGYGGGLENKKYLLDIESVDNLAK